MSTQRIPASTIAEMREMREHMPELTQREIAAAFGVSQYTVNKYLNGYVRKDRKQPKRKQARQKCPKCGAEVTNKGARYCWRCGSDVRSEEFKLCERLMGIFNGHYSLSDEHADAIRDTCRFLGYDPDGRGLMA